MELCLPSGCMPVPACVYTHSGWIDSTFYGICQGQLLTHLPPRSHVVARAQERTVHVRELRNPSIRPPTHPNTHSLTPTTRLSFSLSLSLSPSLSLSRSHAFFLPHLFVSRSLFFFLFFLAPPFFPHVPSFLLDSVSPYLQQPKLKDPSGPFVTCTTLESTHSYLPGGARRQGGFSNGHSPAPDCFSG